MRITYIGHATLLIQLAGVTVLTDPNFDDALGFALGSRLRRVSAPGIALDRLPRLDLVLVTHAHVDHLSLDSLARLPQEVPVWAPPAVARWLAGKGFRQTQAIAPGETMTLGDPGEGGGGAPPVAVHAEAATHVGSRYGFDRWRAQANMYLIASGEHSAFFAGDTALTESTHRLAERVLREAKRTLDVALLPIGHAPRWKQKSFRAGHLTYEDALELFHRLGARYFVPYHWGTFNHLTSGAHDAIERLRAHLPGHARREDVRILEPGQMLEV
jgi:L-ascorbate metabolism protein UlaG (beta-lactamase superfamily)